MTCLAADIADAIVDEINATTWHVALTAARKWIVKWTLRELATIRVTVVPGPASYEIIDRRRDDIRHTMDISVQKKVDPSDNSVVDGLVELLEEMVTHFRGLKLTAQGVSVICTKREFVPGSDAAVAKEHLEDMRTFTGVLRTTWIVRQ